jgi:hypothetical protein
MESDKEYWEKQSRREKEYVYEQIRKILCIHVVWGDITTNSCPPLESQTTEQIRTVFNNGYKLAMHQTLDSLNKLKKIESSNSASLDLAIEQIKDRLITCDCFTRYEGHDDPKMLEQSIKRAKDFQVEVARQNLSSWGPHDM